MSKISFKPKLVRKTSQGEAWSFIIMYRESLFSQKENSHHKIGRKIENTLTNCAWTVQLLCRVPTYCGNIISCTGVWTLLRSLWLDHLNEKVLSQVQPSSSPYRSLSDAYAFFSLVSLPTCLLSKEGQYLPPWCTVWSPCRRGSHPQGWSMPQPI